MTSSIARLEAQPDFPVGDLTPGNTALLKYIIPREPGVAERAAYFANGQFALLQACHNALLFAGYPSRENDATLHAMATGFTAYETMIDLVTEPTEYDMSRAAVQANNTFANDTIGRGIRRGIRNLTALQPRAFSVIQEVAETCKTIEEVNSLTAGAAVARQLQLPVPLPTWR